MILKKGVAFFDFDNTITFKDSFIEFIKFTKGKHKLIGCILLNSPFIILYYLKCYSNKKLKERFFSFFFKNCLKSELDKKGSIFSKNHLSKLCYTSALRLIQWHKEQGHEVYILTASSRIWLNDWCTENGLLLIATEFETINGKYTGKITGKNCYGKEKENRIKDLFEDYNFEESYGYGNDNSDKFFLDKVKNPFYSTLNDKNVHRIMNLITRGRSQNANKIS